MQLAIDWMVDILGENGVKVEILSYDGDTSLKSHFTNPFFDHIAMKLSTTNYRDPSELVVGWGGPVSACDGLHTLKNQRCDFARNPCLLSIGCGEIDASRLMNADTYRDLIKVIPKDCFIVGG